jgi:hypothetical protein
MSSTSMFARSIGSRTPFTDQHGPGRPAGYAVGVGWRVIADADVQETRDGAERLAMDIDPRDRTVRLGLRVVTGGDHHLTSGAISRSFFEAERADWRPAVAWLGAPEAEALLERVAAGYHADMLWSGDYAVRWSDEAWQAGNELYVRVSGLIYSGDQNP